MKIPDTCLIETLKRKLIQFSFSEIKDCTMFANILLWYLLLFASTFTVGKYSKIVSSTLLDCVNSIFFVIKYYKENGFVFKIIKCWCYVRHSYVPLRNANYKHVVWLSSQPNPNNLIFISIGVCIFRANHVNCKEKCSFFGLHFIVHNCSYLLFDPVCHDNERDLLSLLYRRPR